ncbi:MAG TPA: hypothetical protein VKG43_09075 [Acidimicrobiales bacterium]|nr:hypothetical protein [Acidimicrobiales bacterium]
MRWDRSGPRLTSSARPLVDWGSASWRCEHRPSPAAEGPDPGRRFTTWFTERFMGRPPAAGCGGTRRARAGVHRGRPAPRSKRAAKPAGGRLGWRITRQRRTRTTVALECRRGAARSKAGAGAARHSRPAVPHPGAFR